MSDEEIEINILIPVEEETVFKPDTTSPGIGERLAQTGRQAAGSAQSVWDSERRQQAGAALRDGAVGAVKGGRAVVGRAATSHVARRARAEALNFPGRARRGLALSLRWTSDRLARLAARLSEKTAPPE